MSVARFVFYRPQCTFILASALEPWAAEGMGTLQASRVQRRDTLTCIWYEDCGDVSVF